MAPPKEYKDRNPGVIPQFEATKKTVLQPNGKKITITDYRPKPGKGYSILSDEVLTSGNTDLLRKFRDKNSLLLQDTNNEPAKLYLDARIKTAEKLDKMEKKAKEEAALGITPPKMEVVNKDGFIGLPKIKYPDYQTSSNGCWSISYSMLLKSRGVDLSQEEIRLWRPDYPEGTKPEEMADPERKLLMNSDRGNAIYPNGDLAGKVLPNTAVNQLRLEPFETELLSVNGKALSKAQKTIVEDEYCAQVKAKLREQITDALVTHQSPVAVSVDGHYVTVTGISEDGNTIRYEESLGAEKKSARTRTMTLDELVDLGMRTHYHGGSEIEGGGIELAWLSDIPQAQHDSPDKPVVNEEHKDFVKMGADGSLTVDVPTHVPGFASAGFPQQGQVAGKAVEQMLEMDQTELSKKIGANVSGIGPNGGILIGNKGCYYPKKTVQKGDPELLKNAYKNLKKDFGNIESALRFAKNESAGQDDLKLSGYLKSIEQLKNNKNLDKDSLAAGKQTMQEICDFFLEKGENGKTRFEQYCYTMNDASRKKFAESFVRLNQAAELGMDEKVHQLSHLHNRMEEQYTAEVNEGRIKTKKHMARVTFEKGILESWEFALKNAVGIATVGPKSEEVKDKLAYVAAGYTLHQQMIEKGIDPPYPTNEEIQAMVPKIRSSEAFDKTVSEGMQSWLTLPKGKSFAQIDVKDYKISEFLDAIVKNQSVLDSEKDEIKRYAIGEKRMEFIQRRAGRIADRLDATETGSYTGMGVISRRKNSGKFENTKNAIRKFSEEENPSPEKTRRAVKTVLSYLEGKEKVRTRGFGRTRWNECMSFLASTMPRDQFEAYCAEVNTKRGVGPKSKDFIGPEDFYPPGTTINGVMTDSKNRITRGEGTARDYARIIAARMYGDDNGWFEKEAKCESPEEKKLLRRETDRILRDPAFATFMAGASKEALSDMMKGEADDLVSAWNAHKELNKGETKTAGETGPLPQV